MFNRKKVKELEASVFNLTKRVMDLERVQERRFEDITRLEGKVSEIRVILPQLERAIIDNPLHKVDTLQQRLDALCAVIGGYEIPK